MVSAFDSTHCFSEDALAATELTAGLEGPSCSRQKPQVPQDDLITHHMKWCNSQASASCFNSQVQTSCASFSMALLLLKMLALGWGARKNVQRKGLNTNQLIWLKSLMPESMRCLNDQAQWSDAKWSLHASVSHWSCSARLKHFLLQFDKKNAKQFKDLVQDQV